MRNLGKPGKISLASEVTSISPFGLWILIAGKEYFLDHKRFPWFRGASVESVLEVENPGEGHIRWPKLDIDLHIDSLDTPELYPMVAKRRSLKNPNKRIKIRKRA